MLFPRPQPRRAYTPLERLTFDPRLQMRAGPLTDPAWVDHLAAQVAARVELPPIGAVEDGVGDRARLWVFAGFHRGELYRRLDRGQVVVDLYPGTFEDALFWAMGENADGSLNRKPGDLARAVGTLLDSPRLLDRVRTAGGGLHAAIAAACRTSDSTVARVLDQRGLRIYAGQIVPKPAGTTGPTTGQVSDSIPPGLSQTGVPMYSVGDGGEILEDDADDDFDDDPWGAAPDPTPPAPKAPVDLMQEARVLLRHAIGTLDVLMGAIADLAAGPRGATIGRIGRRRKVPQWGADGLNVLRSIRGVLEAAEKST